MHMSELNIWIEKARILELFAEYTFAFDDQDADTWSKLFTPNGIYEVHHPDIGVKVSGHTKLMKYAKSNFDGGVRHIQTCHLTELDSETAHHKCAMSHVLTTPEKVVVCIAGWYETWLSKTNGDWKIRHRIAYPD